MSKHTYTGNPKSWLTTVIEERDGSKHVTILSAVHVNKEYTMPHCYSLAWPDWKIMQDSDYLQCVKPFL